MRQNRDLHIQRSPLRQDWRQSRDLRLSDFRFRRWLTTSIVLLFAALTWVSLRPGLLIAAETPSGTIVLSGGSIAAGVGYTWGKGTLIFDGKEYPLRVDGLSLLHVGANRYVASGTVYNLTKVSEINGTYTAVSGGLGGTIAGGAPETTMKNPSGVIIQLTATHAGLAFNLGPNGVTISPEK